MFIFRRYVSSATKTVSVFQIGNNISSIKQSKVLARASTKKSKTSLTSTPSDHQALKKSPTSLKKEIDSLQQQYPTHILLVQVGMFYEIYGSYVDEIAAILGLRIGVHKSAEGSDHRFSRFAGFPTVSLRNHLDVLLQHGKTVAICDQVKPNPTSDYVYRKVSRIVTPGTLVEDSDLDADNSFLLSLYSKNNKFGLAYLDVSTGEFNISTATIKTLATDLIRVQPKEIIVPESFAANPELSDLIKENLPLTLVSVKPETMYSSEESLSNLSRLIIENDPSKAIFHSRPLDALKGLKPLQSEAASGLLSYLSETFPSSKPSVRTPKEVLSKDVLQLDSTSIAALEITRTQREGNKRGSLLAQLDKTKTAAGHRLLSSRLKAPSTDIKEIGRRLDLINLLFNDTYLTTKVITILSECKDIERALQRVHLETGAPSDLANIIHTLACSNSLKVCLTEKLEVMNPGPEKESLSKLIVDLGDFKSIIKNLQGLISEEASTDNRMASLGVIQSGVSANLDKERTIYSELLQKQEERTIFLSTLFSKPLVSCASSFLTSLPTELKCTFTTDLRLGPVVEIGKATEKTTARIHKTIEDTPELSLSLKGRSTGPTKIKDEVWNQLHQELWTKSELLLSLESELFLGACRDIKGETLNIVNMCRALAELDISSSQATLAFQNGLTRPNMIDTAIVHKVEGGRHPVVESFQLARGNSFVINDAHLAATHSTVTLLTGPNMGGKSTYLRQTALISIIAQTGLYVPCTSATLSIVDKIFTRIGSSDDLSANQSTFMIEMKETANILYNATERSLVIMDEVGRGTSTKDGISLALAIIEHLVSVNKALCIFATHYHELATLIPEIGIKRVSFYQAACIVDENDRITCLHKIIPGVMDQSHGIKIAEVAGLPKSIIDSATKYYKNLV